MLYFSLINYKNNNNKILISNFLFIIKKIIFLKLKKKYIFFLNIKQIILLLFLNKYWKKINFKNLILILTNKNKSIFSNVDSYFKLMLISKKIVKNNYLNLNNLFNKCYILIWTNIGSFELKYFNSLKLNKENLIIESIDKIPFLIKFLIPNNIRISNTNRVRLGSYICKGVTVMSEGYINFNTYIGKNSMIEGRVSSGVSINNNTDIGGSASIMGTLSGGGNILISIGNNCLLGANSGLGISIGNNCIIESGLYITSGLKIFLKIKNKYIIVKSKKLSFVNNLIFYRNSLTGKIECLKNKKKINKININLHKN
ncbi:MAG: DapH/DapD/GlmU-related protein [Candidatus Carsonella ruddii]